MLRLPLVTYTRCGIHTRQPCVVVSAAYLKGSITTCPPRMIPRVHARVTDLACKYAYIMTHTCQVLVCPEHPVELQANTSTL